MSVREVFTLRLKDGLALSKVSQRELARRISVHPNTVQKWLKGENLPELDKIDGIADVLNVTPSWLIGGPLESDRELKLRKIKELIEKAQNLDYLTEIIDTFINSENDPEIAKNQKKA